MLEEILVVVKGGGDLATGVAHRLHRVGMKVIVTELAQPTVIRRAVAFASAVFEGEVTVEGVVARRVEDAAQALALLPEGGIPVLVNPSASVVRELKPNVVVDAIIANLIIPMELWFSRYSELTMAKSRCSRKSCECPAALGTR